MKGSIRQAGIRLLLCGLLLNALALQAEETTLAEPLTAAPAGTPSDSNAESTNQQLAALIQTQDYQAAYQLAAPLLSLYEGDPSFDFYYGFSAAQLGYFNEALFSFERLNSQFPDVARYRLELARAYYYLGDYDAAEQHFLQVQSSKPPAQVEKTIDQFLQRIQEQRQAVSPSWGGFVSVSGGYDSNYNTATDLNEIDLLNGLLTARLNRDQRAKGSGYYQLRAQGSYTSPLTRRSAVDLQTGVSRKDNAADDLFDLDNLYASAGMRLIRGRHNLRLGGRYSHYWLGRDDLLGELSANLEWNYLLTPQWQPIASLTLSNQNSLRNDDLDLLQAELQLGAAFSAEQFSARFALISATDDGKQDFQARDTLGLNLDAQLLLSIHSSLYTSLLLRDYRFQGEIPTDNLLAGGETRAEQLTQAMLGYGYTLLPTLTFYTQLNYVQYDSNLPLYEYDRTLIEAGVNLTF
ncbi:MAG: hypothetical protein LRY66_04000 [Saccharospirillaceae bacterium]|nr:hypothetical protein [Saccharospirillaceae bacterium]MCD8530520.1 hypothetical protein [Saccharospirillaceae bacterium]